MVNRDSEQVLSHVKDTRRLDEVADVIDSLHQTPSYEEYGVPMVRVTDIKPGYLNLNQTVKVSAEVYEEFTKRHKPKRGDIVFSRVGTYGVVSFVNQDEPFCLGQNTAVIVPNINEHYLFYCLQSPYVKQQIEQAVVGSSQGTISLKNIKGLEIQMRSPDDVDAIACILGALDDKIELNHQMNRTLEEVAQALFKSWFVDFDPVTAKAGGLMPYGINATTAALFPTRFADSELGLIPEGWEPSKLGVFVSITTGKSYASKELQDSSTALVTLKSFNRGGGYRPDGLKAYIGSYKPEQVVKNGELIIACTDVTQAAEVVGRPAMVMSNPRYSTLVASLDVMIIRPHAPNTTLFFYHLMRSTDYVNHIVAQTNGTTVLHLSKDGVPAFKFACPGSELMDLFSKIASPTFVKIENNFRESETLAALRDALLPKLLSGEIRVRQAENLVAEAV